MVHVVKILGYSTGALHFELDGRAFHARSEADPEHAAQAWQAGAMYPVSLTVAAEGKVDYADAGQPGIKVLQAQAAGDKVALLGRTWDTIDHQTIKLDASPTVGVRLNLPQAATDFRGGSWLSVTGVLCADLPADDHD
jgi:hypothetical protein